jgi:hypothetical protein
VLNFIASGKTDLDKLLSMVKRMRRRHLKWNLMNSTAARCFALANFSSLRHSVEAHLQMTRGESFRYYEAICMNNISERNCFTLRRDRKTFLFYIEGALEST